MKSKGRNEKQKSGVRSQNEEAETTLTNSVSFYSGSWLLDSGFCFTQLLS